MLTFQTRRAPTVASQQPFIRGPHWPRWCFQFSVGCGPDGHSRRWTTWRISWQAVRAKPRQTMTPDRGDTGSADRAEIPRTREMPRLQCEGRPNWRSRSFRGASRRCCSPGGSRECRGPSSGAGRRRGTRSHQRAARWPGGRPRSERVALGGGHPHAHINAPGSGSVGGSMASDRAAADFATSPAEKRTEVEADDLGCFEHAETPDHRQVGMFRALTLDAPDRGAATSVFPPLGAGAVRLSGRASPPTITKSVGGALEECTTV